MRIAVTGTPGTGKTTAVDRVSTELDVIHLNDVVREHGLTSGHDETRDTLVADLEAVRAWLGDRDDVIIESHLAHHLDVDRVIVLRCRPDVLGDRLRDRGENESTIAENAESEALDLLLSEAVSVHGLDRVHEVETTDRPPAEVAAIIEAVIAGKRESAAGVVDFTEYL